MTNCWRMAGSTEKSTICNCRIKKNSSNWRSDELEIAGSHASGTGERRSSDRRKGGSEQ